MGSRHMEMHSSYMEIPLATWRWTLDGLWIVSISSWLECVSMLGEATLRFLNNHVIMSRIHKLFQLEMDSIRLDVDFGLPKVHPQHPLKVTSVQLQESGILSRLQKSISGWLESTFRWLEGISR